MLTEKDKLYLESFSIEETGVLMQIELFEKNSSFMKIKCPVTPEKGMVVINEIDEYADIYDNRSPDFNIQKFVPASGAATRMFKRLISFYNNPGSYDINNGDFYSVKTTFEEIDNFAFFDKLKRINIDINDRKVLSEAILYSVLGYANIPKGLIDFHRYENYVRTAFEEHIIEAISLSNSYKIVKIHFTISKEHENLFKNELNILRNKLKSDIDIDFSFQEKYTDTIAIYDDGKLVRDDDGNILLRPGGHGSLLHNLNKLDSDFIFIKNIDNVVHESYLEDTIKYKKFLGGILIKTIDKIKEIYNILIEPNCCKNKVTEVITYLNEEIGGSFSVEATVDELMNFINRPIRVCGMVKNTGEPGGGPFWVKGCDGMESLQIVEKAQIDLLDPEQNKEFNKSTHFNPVDMVCYIRNPKGEKFDLNKYVDKNASFISEKTHNGKAIRVLEHPGLWNGAMSDWLTIFVEVPLFTFNPVKELNDLLRKEHQPGYKYDLS